MILVQPGLPRASGMTDGPDRWEGEGFQVDEIVPALDTSPIGVAAWPDGAGAHWLLGSLVYLPDTNLWWHYGRWLKPADRTMAERMARAHDMLQETASWVGLGWGELPGKASPASAPGSLGALLRGLAISASGRPGRGMAPHAGGPVAYPSHFRRSKALVPTAW